MVFVSHDPIDVQALCDDLVVLRDGAIVARGAPRDVLTDPSVFPLADERGFENVIPCSTLSTDAARTEVRLGSATSDLTLTVINRSPVRGPARLVGIPARDILVATERPSGLSARNVLAAVIEEVHAVGNVQLIKARLDESLPLLAVEVGREAVEELSLLPGKSVFLIVKAMSCTLYEESFAG
jgi:molybdate transport system ATP-binding protein